MDTNRPSSSGTQMFARIQTNPSPIVQISYSPIQTPQGTVMMPVASVTQNFSPTLAAQKHSVLPIHLSNASGVVIAGARRDGIPTSSLQGAERGRISAGVMATTPVHMSSERGRMSASGVAMVTRRDVEMGEGHQEESRPNMSRLSSVLNSLSDQDQASMDLEVQSVMFPGKE